MPNTTLLLLLLVVAILVMAFPHRPDKVPVRFSPFARAAGLFSRPWMIALLGLFAVVIGFWALRQREGTPDVREAPLVAILPFSALGAEASVAAEGLTEELTTALGRMDGVRVASSDLSRRLADPEAPTDAGRRGFDGDFFVEGSVELEALEEETHLRVRVRLVDVEHASQLWSQSYHYRADALFELERRILQDIADYMGVRNSRDKPNDILEPRTRSREAHELYLIGDAHRQGILDADETLKAITAFRQAASIDPEFGAALAAQAAGHIWLAWFHGYTNQLGMARVILDRAESLDPGDEDVRLARALWAWSIDQDFESALQQYRDMQPGGMQHREPLFGNYIAHIKSRVGLRDEALSLARSSLAIAPFFGVFNANLGEILLHDGQFLEAQAAFSRTIATGVNESHIHRWLALAPLLEGDTAVAGKLLLDLGPDAALDAIGNGLFWEARTLMRVLGPGLPTEWSIQLPEQGPTTAKAGVELAVALLTEIREGNEVARPLFEVAVSDLSALLSEDAELAPAFQVRVLGGLSVALSKVGRGQEAVRRLRDAAPLLRERGDFYALSDLLWALCESQLVVGNIRSARVTLAELESLTRTMSPALLSVDPLLGLLEGG